MAMDNRDIFRHEFNKKRGQLTLGQWVSCLKNDLIYHLIQYVDDEAVERKALAREVEALRAEVEALKNPPEDSLSSSPWIGNGQS